MIKAIIFDLSEVCLTGMKDVELLLEPLLKLPAEKIGEQIRGGERGELFNGKITEDEYWQKIINTNRWKVEASLLKKTIRLNFKEIDGTRDIIEKLKQRGYKLGLLSVHTKEWIDHCESRFDYHKLFDDIMYSFDAGVSKPDRKAFRLMLTKMDVNPAETLFIDDNPENIGSAQRLGLNTVHFQNAIQLRDELGKINLLQKI